MFADDSEEEDDSDESDSDEDDVDDSVCLPGQLSTKNSSSTLRLLCFCSQF